MEIKIDNKKTLEEIQKEFSRRFPFLKIQFYKQSHPEGAGSPKFEILSNHLRLEEVQKTNATKPILINGLMKVSDLEKVFDVTYGLPVQVFRKSANIWLQTTKSDNITLAEQNLRAKEMQESLNRPEEHIDYREQD